MGIAVLGCALLLFKYRIREESSHNQILLWGAVFFYFLFSLFLNWYLRNVYGWEYGIPGSDLRMYYDAAVALKQGKSLSYLTKINESFDLSIIHLGYIAYILFITITALSPVLFTVEISLQVLYCVQIIVAIVAVLNIADFLCDKEDSGNVRNKVFIMLLLCAAVFQMPCLLMRDIWIFFFISLVMRECKKEDNSRISHIKCLLYMLICFVTRSYTLAITLPIYIAYKLRQKKVAAIGSLAVFAAFLIGQDLISRVAQIAGIKWALFHFDLYSLASFILFPNPISQAYNVQHLNMGYHAIFGGNTEWIYYLLSCWNLYVFPVAIYGAFKCIKQDKKEDLVLWGMIIVNIAMLMCLFYGGTSSPRHKLLIVISLAFLFKEGIKNIDTLKRVLYYLIMSAVIITILIITN